MPLPITVLAEHDDFIIVNKPAGVPMHDPRSGIVRRVKETVGEGQWHLCHRLDTETSGCLCLARHADAAARIGELFASRSVEKYYLALSESKPSKKQGTISGDMKNRRRGQHILLKTKTNPAVTQFFSYGVEPGLRGFLVRPLTGKTHQIRVALKSVGSPILGDERYGGGQADRLYLHAWQIGFCYNNELVRVTCSPQGGDIFLRPTVAAWLDTLGDPAQKSWPAYTLPRSNEGGYGSDNQ